MSGEKRKGGFDWGKQVKAGRGAPIEIGDTEFSFTAHACIARNNQPSGNFLGIIGIPKSVKDKISAGAIKDKLEKTIAEALLYEPLKDPKDNIAGWHFHVLSVAHFDQVVERLSNIKDFGVLQVKNRAALMTKTPPVVTLTFLDDKTAFRLDGRVYPLTLHLKAYGFEFLDPETMQTPARDEANKKWLAAGAWLLPNQSGSAENKAAVVEDLNNLFATWGFLCHAQNMMPPM